MKVDNRKKIWLSDLTCPNCINMSLDEHDKNPSAPLKHLTDLGWFNGYVHEGRKAFVVCPVCNYKLPASMRISEFRKLVKKRHLP